MSLPRMSLHIGDYKKDTSHLRAAGHGAYLMLIMHYWATGGLPDDDEQLASIACLSDKEWRKWKPTLQRFFQDGWRHKRIDQELAEAIEKYERRVEAGRRGGQAKAQNNPSNARAMLKQPITDNPKEEEQPSQNTHTPRAVANATRPGRESSFQEFWKAYPKRGDAANPKKPAQDRFERLVKSGHDPTEIIAGARRYAEIERRSGRAGTEKIAQAIKWLEQQRWNDYPAPSLAAGASATIPVREGTEQWAAWQRYLKSTTGKGSPCVNGEWHFPTEWPPTVEPIMAQVH